MGYKIIVSNAHIGYSRQNSRGDVTGHRTLEGQEVEKGCEGHELLKAFAECLEHSEGTAEAKALPSEPATIWTIRVYRAENLTTPILGYQLNQEKGMYRMNVDEENLTDEERQLFEKYKKQSEYSES